MSRCLFIMFLIVNRLRSILLFYVFEMKICMIINMMSFSIHLNEGTNLLLSQLITFLTSKFIKHFYLRTLVDNCLHLFHSKYQFS